jgi:hypothetical protein
MSDRERHTGPHASFDHTGNLTNANQARAALKSVVDTLQQSHQLLVALTRNYTPRL